MLTFSERKSPHCTLHRKKAKRKISPLHNPHLCAMCYSTLHRKKKAKKISPLHIAWWGRGRHMWLSSQRTPCLRLMIMMLEMLVTMMTEALLADYPAKSFIFVHPGIGLSLYRQSVYLDVYHWSTKTGSTISLMMYSKGEFDGMLMMETLIMSFIMLSLIHI